MVCKSWLEGGFGSYIELCGCDEWVCVSWDKVIELVCNEIVWV